VKADLSAYDMSITHGGTMTTTDTPERLQLLRRHFLTDGDDAPAKVCLIDGYPTYLSCTCGHAHTRHTETGRTACMSLSGQPDCPCTRFVPSPESCTATWEALVELVDRLDVDRLTDLVPDLRLTSSYVRDWPADEQALWDSFDKDQASRTAAMEACDAYRRRKVAQAVVNALVGA
jgi:hypothetical protein